MKVFALTILIVVQLAAASNSVAGTFRAGAAAANITPPLGIEINGGTAPVIATHVHDELHARALVLDDGSTRLAFVLVDACLIDRAVFDAAKALIFQHTGISSNHVSMSTTHTHSAGSVTGVHLTEPDPTYRAWLPRRLADAVRLAVNQLAPARVAWGSGSVPQHVFCRRVTVKPDATYTNLLGVTGHRVKMNWSSPEPAVDGDFSSPVDPEVFVLSVQHADGPPLSLLANYSLHYAGGVGSGHLSADYFGVFCERMKELLGAEKQEPTFVALMSNGTSGDINNNDFRKARLPQKPYEQIRIVAEDVAREMHSVVKTLTYRDDLKLSAFSTELEIAVRKPSPAEVERARDTCRRISLPRIATDAGRCGRDAGPVARGICRGEEAGACRGLANHRTGLPARFLSREPSPTASGRLPCISAARCRHRDGSAGQRPRPRSDVTRHAAAAQPPGDA